jgi:membrane peptidoglycan carboxypeptidase
MPRRKKSPARRVTIVDFAVAIVGFVVFSVLAGFLAAAIVLPGAAVAGSAVKGTIEMFDSLPAELEFKGLPQQSNIYASDTTTLIATFYVQNRVVVPLEEISTYMQKAIVAIEDKRFWEHNGVDGEGLLRAIVHNVSTGETQGASTLTQQLVKNMLVNAAIEADDQEAVKAATEATAARKLGEARRALALEEKYNAELGDTCTDDPKVDCGKEQVLEQYLNVAQFGTSVYGVESAALLYFNKHAKDLNAVEAATIAGITQNPYKWDPQRFPENAQIRRDTVLSVMRDLGPEKGITEAEYQEAIAMPIADTLHINPPKFSCVASPDAPFFCDYVTKVIMNDPFFEGKGKEYLYYGANIVTTLDINMQRIANQELVSSIPPADPMGIANALVALNPKNGHILVMSQNTTFNPAADNQPGETSINYSVDREYGGSRGFSPGSTFKVVILADWLETGHGLNQIVNGSVRSWPSDSWTASCIGPAPFAGQAAWTPENVGGVVSEQRTVLSATVDSVNTAFAAITNQLDLCGIEKMAARLGFKRADGMPFETVPSVTLGTNNASPLTMAVVGATIANDGVRCEPRSIVSITKLDGTTIPVPLDSCTKVIEPQYAQGVQFAMTQVVDYGSGEAAKLKGGRIAAGKTGSSQNNSHAWFLGFTPQVVAVTWMGNPDVDIRMQYITINGKFYKRVGGGTLPALTWKHFMDRALEGLENLPMQTSEPLGLGGLPLTVPDVVGMTEEDARHAINDAGFGWILSPMVVYNENVAPGIVIEQSTPAGETLPSGASITYKKTMNTLPAWWSNWPETWDPCFIPLDWWGPSWPPPGWGPDGWDDSGCSWNEPAPEPSVTPSPSPTT